MQEIRRLDLRWWRHLRRELEIEKIIPEIYLLLPQEFIAHSVGMLIFIVDKRQNSHLEEIIQTQHKLTREIHEMLTEEIRLIDEMKRENNKG
ncbi:MAG TPA: hypothetical protein VE971_04020 [Candidatus Eisenbacteria bacterium]|nr:hypothetical protein [Candidatus Eisenbacteria bacterium]